MMDFEDYAEIFKALSHPLRLKIACGLSRKDNCCVSKMVDKLGVAQPTVSQHLNIMKNAGVIEGYRNGNQICYKLVSEHARSIISSLEVKGCEQ